MLYILCIIKLYENGNCDGSYYIVGGDSIPILCKTKEIAQKQCELLNQD